MKTFHFDVFNRDVLPKTEMAERMNDIEVFEVMSSRIARVSANGRPMSVTLNGIEMRRTAHWETLREFQLYFCVESLYIGQNVNNFLTGTSHGLNESASLSTRALLDLTRYYSVLTFRRESHEANVSTTSISKGTSSVVSPMSTKMHGRPFIWQINSMICVPSNKNGNQPIHKQH
jgi:hypothetical protein